MQINRSVVMILAVVSCAAAVAAADPVILTPAPSLKPRINGATLYGARPGHPFLYTIPASGAKPMIFSARGLPNGLKLDSRTGQITGVVRKTGDYAVLLRARNSLGKAERKFHIVIGDRLALTPPMGWSTWYMARTAISDAMVRAQADAMISSGMAEHGYAYIDIDDGWNVNPDSPDPALGGPARDEKGNLRGNKNFPDMKALCDYVHSKGLKIGIYISPGPRTCNKFEGSYGHEEQDARQFAAWGFDLLKYDYCSYSSVIKDESVTELQKPYRLMGELISKQNRDFIFNLCQYGKGSSWEWAREVGGHFWRTGNDVGRLNKMSLWENMSLFGFGQAGLEKFAGPGGWNDPDNILLGHIIRRGSRRTVPTPLTPDEQYTWMSLWSLMASPLIFGGDMTKLDPFTLSLLTNDEVIEVNQDPLGKQASRVVQASDIEIWSKELEDGSKAAGLFNRGGAEAEITVHWSDLGAHGRQIVRDLWRQKEIGRLDSEFKARVASHGVVLVKITPAR